MRVSCMHEDGRVAEIDVDPAETIENVAAIIEAEVGVLVAQQELQHNGVVINGGADARRTLESFGVKNGDLIIVRSLRAPSGGAGNERARRGRPPTGGLGLVAPPAKRQAVLDPTFYTAMTWEDLPGGVGPDTLHAILQVNLEMMSVISRRDPELAAAARQPMVGPLRTLMMQRSLQHALPEAEKGARLAELEARLASNPYDAEAQHGLEDIIAQKNIDENMEMAMEHMPEAFARVFMLYVPALINGVPVKVFVDSGAQSTILSKRCAERCNIQRLVDTKFAGVAVGVGTSKILGRVHMAPLVIAGQHFPCTFTVIESGDIECLFGLDMLKRYQSCIDLRAGMLRLRLGDTEVAVPFLGEGELPKGTLGGDQSSGEGGGEGAADAPAEDGGGAGAAAAGSGSGGAGGSSSSSGGSAASSSAPAPPASSSTAAALPPPPQAGAGSVGSSAPSSATGPAAGAAAPSSPAAPSLGGGAAAAAGGGGADLFSAIDLSSLMPPPPAAAAAGHGRGHGGGTGTGRGTGRGQRPATAAARSSRGGVTGLLDLSALMPPLPPPPAAAATGSGGGGSVSAAAPPLAAAPAPAPAVATASAPAPAPAAAAAAVAEEEEDESKVQALLGLGFPRGTCVTALRLAGGDLERAAALLPDL